MADERTVWYRKWRPQTFSEVAGQDHVTRTLRNAVASGRLAHAYLLCGPRGTGKTTTARLLAKAVNCERPRDGDPCDSCASCIAMREGRALDLVEMDAASNRGIDDIRGLRDRVGYAATGGGYKVYLIDEVHELTQQAFDALLKTLEEPPPKVIFVLATTDAHKVPATIVSRCQRFDLVRARLADLVGRLQTIAQSEGVQIDPDALAQVARAATGSFRDAVNLLEQLRSAYGGEITLAQAREGLGLTGDERAGALARAVIEGDLRGGLGLIAAVRDDGVDLRQFTREVCAQLRALLLLIAGVEDSGVEAGTLAGLRPLAEKTDVRAVTRALKTFNAIDFRADPQASLPLELALVEVALTTGGRGDVASAPAQTPPTAQTATRPEAVPVAPTRAPVVEPDGPPGGFQREAQDGRDAVAAGGATAQHTPPANGAAGLRERLVARADGAGSATVRSGNAGRMSADAPIRSGAPADVVRRTADIAAPAPVAGVVARADDAHPPVPSPQVASGGSPPPNSVTRNGAGTPDGSLTLAEARRRYRDVYQSLKRDRPIMSGTINGGDIVAVDEETITFAVQYQAVADKLAPGTDALAALTATVQTVFGRPYRVHCVQQSDVQDRLKAQPPKESHLLDEALKLGARPI